MELKDQVCSYEQAVKLKKHNVKAEHFFHYTSSGNFVAGMCITSLNLPAYTASELMGVLPSSMRLTEMIDYELALFKGQKNQYAACYERIKNDGGTEKFYGKVYYSENAAHALSDLLIWLLETNHIKAEDLRL